MCLKRLGTKTKLLDLAKWEFLIILNLTVIEKEQKPECGCHRLPSQQV